jgi:hypothetical protein
MNYLVLQRKKFMEKILKDLENLQKSFKLYTLIIVLSLILIISYPSYNIIIYLTKKTILFRKCVFYSNCFTAYINCSY